MPGHKEGDLLRGAANRSAVGVLVERTTRPALLAKMDDAAAGSALATFGAKLDVIAAPLRRTPTCDQGRERASHCALTGRTGARVYFCDPHSPWQRGTCGNTSGLPRQDAPQGHRPLGAQPGRSRRHRRRDEQPPPVSSRDWHSPPHVYGEMAATRARRSTSTVQ